jgi:hypothetical protein
MLECGWYGLHRTLKQCRVVITTQHSVSRHSRTTIFSYFTLPYLSSDGQRLYWHRSAVSLSTHTDTQETRNWFSANSFLLINTEEELQIVTVPVALQQQTAVVRAPLPVLEMTPARFFADREKLLRGCVPPTLYTVCHLFTQSAVKSIELGTVGAPGSRNWLVLGVLDTLSGCLLWKPTRYSLAALVFYPSLTDGTCYCSRWRDMLVTWIPS